MVKNFTLSRCKEEIILFWRIDNMKKKCIAGAALAVFLSGALSAQSAYDIMKAVKDRYQGETAIYKMKLTLLSAKGSARERQVIYYSKDYGDTEKSVMVFQTPKDVAGVGYLVWSYDEKDKDDNTWLYMPAMKKVRRISGSGKDGYFMGTDFTYDDMGNRDLSKDDFNLIGEEEIDGESCWKIECIPQNRTEKNSRRICWVRKDNAMLLKSEYYNRQNALERVLTISGVKQVDGIWTAETMTMKNLLSGHSTIIETADISYNQPIDDALFTVSSLERGAVK